MRKMILFMECGVGTKTAEAVLVSEDDFDAKGYETKELSDTIWQYALNHAEMYGIYPKSDMPEDYDEDDHDYREDEYSDDIEGWLEPYDPDEHDGYMCGDQREWDWREI